MHFQHHCDNQRPLWGFFSDFWEFFVNYHKGAYYLTQINLYLLTLKRSIRFPANLYTLIIKSIMTSKNKHAKSDFYIKKIIM